MTSPVAIIGAGPAGLMAAEVLSGAGHAVTVYDRMPSIGRKFLMAGRGGLNLTHSEPLERLLLRYDEAAPRLSAALRRWPPEALREWCRGLGQDTFVGSSGRVFPVAMKASPLLRAWRVRLTERQVGFALRHRWTGWGPDGNLLFATPEGRVSVLPAATVLALGGASWPRLGSDGTWAETLQAIGVGVHPFLPANCGFHAPWSAIFAARHEGEPLKSVALAFDGTVVRGDVVITREGLEGGALYPLSAPLRSAILAQGRAILSIALRPDLSTGQLSERWAKRKPKESLATALKRTLHLAPAAIGLLQEAAHQEGRSLAGLDAPELVTRINAVPVRLNGIAPLDRAISTAGGLAFDDVDDAWMLRRQPGTFVAGEMLDWEAPTGGYLLQACFATGVAAAEGVLAWLGGLDAPRVSPN
ncbi:TIGR03862 family flavoprotein [Lichenifustis flavocetrariae]|uniref:TIGR03862 family flavoprotein n=1 Tax=Lichenifustis flavocetrariae TaxID=2949735 RepID=A0AA42CP09_9HYPH|nr:TIGR03862 family flavoprotein [Lichenifustis flavocetrariae]MCW6509947.1 TIGR03862 family flavoprotein [Lichenifustis flavocetrariae]